MVARGELCAWCELPAVTSIYEDDTCIVSMTI